MCLCGIDEGELNWAGSVTDRAASHRGRLGEIAKDNGLDAEEQLASQSCAFYATKMLLYWKQGNQPLANNTFLKAAEGSMAESLSQPSSAEDMANALFGIGNELVEQKSYPLAIQWLQRAFDVLDKVEVMNLSEPGSELRWKVTCNLGMRWSFEAESMGSNRANSESVHHIGHSRESHKSGEYHRDSL